MVAGVAVRIARGRVVGVTYHRGMMVASVAVRVARGRVVGVTYHRGMMVASVAVRVARGRVERRRCGWCWLQGADVGSGGKLSVNRKQIDI